MTVIARNSSFAYRGQDVDARSIGADLGVRYLIDGSVRRSGNRVRINAQLTSATDATQIWAKRFDRDLGDVFDLQDDIVGEITTALAGAIPRDQRPKRSRATNIDAYDLFARGRALVMHSVDGNDAGRPLLVAAIAKDPAFAVL